MTDQAQERKDALVRQLHDLGKTLGEITVTVVEAGLDTHLSVVEFHDPSCRDVVVAEAVTQLDGRITIEEVWLPEEALEVVGHAILRALAKDVRSNPVFKVTYIGDGVATNTLGAFQNGTIAFTDDEAAAKEIAASVDFEVLDRDGRVIPSAPAIAREPLFDYDLGIAVALEGGSSQPRHFDKKKREEKKSVSEDERGA